MKRIKINARRIPEEKRFVTRELSEEVTKLTIAKVLEYDQRKKKIMRHVTVNRDIISVLSHNSAS